MARQRVNDFGTIETLLDNIKKLNGQRYNVSVTIDDNGKSDSENPAYYGTILEEQRGNTANHGRDYRFLEPALNNFAKKLSSGDDMKEFLKIVKADGKKRGKKEMEKASQFYGEKAVEAVQEYILYNAPQYPDRQRKNPTLLETGELYDSIKFVIRDKAGRVIKEGR